MRFKVVIIFALIGFASGAVTPSNKYIKEPEEAILEVVYSRKAITDTTMRDTRFFLDDVILRIGKTKSMFCGDKKLWSDSLSKVDYASYHALMVSSFERKDYFAVSGKYWAYIYKDFQDSICKEYEYFDMERRKYNERLQIPEWTVTDSVKTVIGYECFKATTDFKGRHWTAWFAPEIPVSDGPWKLHGLPGLILEAYDRSHDYEFEAKGIRSAGVSPVGYMEYKDYVEVSRDRFMKDWWESKHKDMGAIVKAAYNINSESAPAKKRIPRYDREEIDYDHSLK